MPETNIAGTHYRIVAVRRDDRWTAHAEREGGDRYGIEVVAATEEEALARLTRWLQWQAEHAAALAALQAAEQAYHRTIAGSAFANPTEGPSAIEIQKEALGAVEAARVRLDEVRASKPE